MFRHILIPTDGSALSTEALEKALDFAGEIKADVTILVVIEPMQVFTINPAGIDVAYAEYERYSSEEADNILVAAQYAASKRSLTCKTSKMLSADPAGCIVKTAEKHGCDVIAMASHGRAGFKAFMLGSVTMKVLAGSKTPVLVYR